MVGTERRTLVGMGEIERVLEASGMEEREPRGAEPRSTVAVLVANATWRRLIEATLVQLELSSVVLGLDEAAEALTGGHELIIADEGLAREIHGQVPRDVQSDGLNAALLAVRGAGVDPAADQAMPFEGLLIMPQEPSAMGAQLGLILYAHRAYARKYQTALDELRLNRRIFRSVTSGISIANALLPDLPLTYVNPAFEVMTGYSLEDVMGQNCRFLQGAEREQPGVTLLREAIKGEREVVVVMQNFRRDGTMFWNELSLSPIRNREGQLTHFVGIQSDVTARVEFEAALRESEKLAAVGRLAASIAHEINNPLESVMNLLYLARHGDDPNQRDGYLEQADKELQRVAQITSQSLRFYKQSTKATAVRVTDLLEAVLEVYQGRFVNSGVQVERRLRTTDSIVCLESEMRQVLSNVVRNAIDAMHGRGGRLLVRAREGTEWRGGARGIVITLADTGTGIPAETIKHLYTAFFTTKGIGGTGLGLWVSAEIVLRHGGRMMVRSVVGQGTVFQVFLPFQGLAG